MKTLSEQQWTSVIRPNTSWFEFNIKEIWQYRDLILLFVRRDFVSIYKQTILGPAWFILQPLLTTIMFTIVFGNIAQISTDGLPKMLFYMSGTIMWSYFAECLNKTADTFISNAEIFGKVYFPRLVTPISIVISNLFAYGLQYVFFLCFMAFYLFKGVNIHPNFTILLTPLLVLLMAGFGFGIGIIISSLTTRYRDLRFLVKFGVQLFMYATPVIYPVSAIPAQYKLIILLNPMTPIIETFRYAYLGQGTFNYLHLGFSVVMITATIFVGLMMFSKIEKTFMDTV